MHPEDAPDQRGRGQPAAGRSQDLRVTDLQTDHLERLDPRVHAGDHGDTGVGDTVEATERKTLRVFAVALEQVVEWIPVHVGNFTIADVTNIFMPSRTLPRWADQTGRPSRPAAGRPRQIDGCAARRRGNAGARPAQANNKVSSPLRNRWHRTPPVARPFAGYSPNGVTLTAPASVPGRAADEPDTVTTTHRSPPDRTEENYPGPARA